MATRLTLCIATTIAGLLCTLTLASAQTTTLGAAAAGAYYGGRRDAPTSHVVGRGHSAEDGSENVSAILVLVFSEGRPFW